MLVQLGQRQGPTDVVDLLYECHGRIRKFLDMAMRLASSPDADAAVVRDTAGQIRRYFAEAFPLHLADEEELVLPSLRGSVEVLDDVLVRMHADHEDHAPLVAELIEVCAKLHADPRCIVASADRLGAVASSLRTALEPHLELEEREIFPALRQMSARERETIKQGMQARRAAVLAAPPQSLRR